MGEFERVIFRVTSPLYAPLERRDAPWSVETRPDRTWPPTSHSQRQAPSQRMERGWWSLEMCTVCLGTGPLLRNTIRARAGVKSGNTPAALPTEAGSQASQGDVARGVAGGTGRRTDAHLVFGERARELYEDTVGRWHKRPRFGDG